MNTSEIKIFKSKAKTNYTRKGKRNQTNYPAFVKLCKYTQPELKNHLKKWLKGKYETVISGDGYLYAKGNIPVLLTAHLDTVHKEPVMETYEYYDKGKGDIISSPQGIGGDDRCGVYMIKQIILSTEMRPSILFCEDEEIGGIGSDKFCKTEHIDNLSEMLFLIELDRANGNDAVFYDDENADFHDFVERETGYKEAWGSFSDISNLSPACGVASVNLSCGYYNAHTTDEYVVMREMKKSIQAAIKLIEGGMKRKEQFEYIEAKHSYGLYDYYDNYYDDYYYSDYLRTKGKTETRNVYVGFYTNDDKEYWYEGGSLTECIGKLMYDHPDMKWSDVYDYEIY